MSPEKDTMNSDESSESGRSQEYNKNFNVRSRLALVVHVLAIIDIVVYFFVLFASYILEQNYCFENPFRINWRVFQNGFSGSLFQVLHDHGDPTLWDYFNPSFYSSEITFNAIYMSFLSFGVAYLVLEIWICCLLIRASTESNVKLAQKAFWLRMIFLIVTLSILSYDVTTNEITCTGLSFFPLAVLRVVACIPIYVFIYQINKEVKNTSLFAL